MSQQNKKYNCKIFILTLICSFIVLISKAQTDIEQLSQEQYEVLNVFYSKKEKERIKLYYQTIYDPVWIDFVLENKSEEGILLCRFNDSELPKEMDLLNDLRTRLSKKTFNRKMLPHRIKLSKKVDKETMQFISEPIIVNNYAFLYVRDFESEGVWIYNKDPLEKWRLECVAFIAYTISCYG